MRRINSKQRLCYGLILLMAVAFFLISRCGFLWSDDYAMGFGEVFTLSQVLSKAKWFYLNWGGGVLGAACQYLFCGLLGEHKIWFDIVNTIVFLLLVVTCGKLVGGEEKKDQGKHAFLFACLFWFLCPAPRETLFWMVGSTGYLWVTLLAFLFLWCFFEFKDRSSSLLVMLMLFLSSAVTAASIIPCASICGAFVVYYLFHLKEVKGNVIPMVAGFAIGSVALIFAPGNFIRAAVPEANYSLYEKVSYLLHHPFQEVLKYKAFWLLVIALLFGLRRDKVATKNWIKENAILLLTLGWSVIAFSIVFRPADRALFFTEALSIILFLRLVTASSLAHAFRLSSKCKLGVLDNIVRKAKFSVVAVVMLVLLLIDAGCAAHETWRQRQNNEGILTDIQQSGGITGVDLCISKHRMAYAPDYPDWSWKGIAYQLDLDSVHLYPYYCQDKYYDNSSFGKEVYVDEDGLLNYVEEGDLNDMGILFFRFPDVAKDSLHSHASFTIEYNRPHKWYRTLLPNGKNYRYERTAEVVRDTCNVYYAGYDYYFVWMDRDNIEGLRSITCSIE